MAAEASPDEYFTVFVADLVLRQYQLGMPSVLGGVVDGIGDLGIDAMYTFINDQLVVPGVESHKMGKDPRIDVHIFQTKRSTKFTETALEALQLHLPELFDLDRDEAELMGRANPKILDASRQFLTVCRELAHHAPTFQFHIHYATRAENVHPNTRARAQTIELNAARIFSEASARVTFYTPRDLLHLARARETITKELVMADGPLSSDSVRGQGYICLVTLDELYRLVCDPTSSDIHTAIFDANVRDHDTNSSVNASIYDTLVSDDAPDFWWLNNGVTIIAPNVQHMGKRLFLTDPQIVNGLQTSHEIYSYFNQGGVAGDRLVLVRVIRAADETVRDAVIWATNNQNSLPPGALRATDRIQHNIEEYLGARKLLYERRRNSHLRNPDVKWDKIVSVEFLAQSMIACLLGEPWRARRDTALLLENDPYIRIFNDDIPLESYMSCLLLTRRVRRILSTDTRFTSGNFVDDFSFHIAAVSAILLSRHERPTAQDLARIDVNRMSERAVEEVLAMVAVEYSKFIGKRAVPIVVAARDERTADAIVGRARRLLSSPLSRGWPEEPLRSDFTNFGSDVLFRSSRRPRRN